jgi:hypothetical protein
LVTVSRPTIPRGAALGAALGIVWGVLARTWMRLISDEPEFTWSGTLAIIGLAAVLGAGVGIVHATRRQGRNSWWTLAVLPGLLLFMSPGMLLAPAFLLGGPAFVGRGRVLRIVGWVAIAAPVLAMLLFAIGEPSFETDPDLGGLAVALGGFALMALSLAWASSLVWQRRVPRATGKTVQGEEALRVA